MKQASTEAVARIRIPGSSIEQAQETIGFDPVRLVKTKTDQGEKEAILLVKSVVSDNEPPEKHIRDLCSELKRVKYNLAKLPSEAELDIWCTIHSEGEFVGLAVEHALLVDIAELGANLVISYYERDR